LVILMVYLFVITCRGSYLNEKVSHHLWLTAWGVLYTILWSRLEAVFLGKIKLSLS
jgi:hypothetical protein